ncbi:class D beta-lactamase [Methylobacter sp. BlB1]|nr:class D beta-lactamase [Methylobacter sp. BlB1]MBF6647534.1 class D beta-lactamase [Methylobacter sp. BlB1]
MKVIKIVLGALLFLHSFKVGALDWQDSPQVDQLFRSAGVTGTFVLYDVTQHQLIGHNRERAYTPFIPASTFKIANTLVGLSIGAVKSIDETLSYGGKPQSVKAWEKDMSLREAIALSNVAIYQELARRIGLARMRDSLAAMCYGNGEVGTAVDRFWLDGPLKISAVEQTEFLARLVQGTLPFPQTQQETVRESIRLEQQDNWTLYGKTGWENYPNPGVGWWVGWAKKNGHVYVFALNIDIREAADAAKRLELGKASLKAIGVM